MDKQETTGSKWTPFEMSSCNGCKTCEMACSFEHSGEFNPSISAIKILEKADGRGFWISLARENDGNRLKCIGCLACTKSCPASGELEKIIEAFE